MVEQGDIIYLNFTPQSGHEQVGKRPALVVSNNFFNSHNNMTMVCPITNFEPKTPLHVKIDGTTKIHGTILCDQVKCLDIKARGYSDIEKLPDEILDEVLDIIQAIIEKQ